MASSGSVFSQTLQSITNEKLAELSKKRTIFEQQKAEVFKVARTATSAQGELRILLDGVKKCFTVKTTRGGIITGMTNNSRLELNLRNIERFLDQAQYDPSVSLKLLDEWKSVLTQNLEMQGAKYQYASLYAQLVTEWLSEGKEIETTMDVDEEDFEEVASKERLESRAEWEHAVFEPFQTDEETILQYLSALFGQKQSSRALAALKKTLEQFENQLAAPGQFDHYVLLWTIKGLLSSDLLTDDKRAVLKDFKENPTILAEVADVLNMRMAALDTWTWGDSVSIEQRKKLNGTYGIYMHEDLLQAIFLQYIGVKWSVFFKAAFKTFAVSAAWISLRAEITVLDKLRREYFLGTQSKLPSLQSRRQAIHRSNYFMTQLMDRVDQDIEVADGDEEADYDIASIAQAFGGVTQQTAQAPPSHSRTLQPARRQMRQVPKKKRIAYEEEEDGEEVDSEEVQDDDKPKNPMELKQSLLHLLSTEILINTRIHGELSCFHAGFDRWNSALPHSTIRGVMRFFGLSSRWLTFFDRFMKAPLAFPSEEPRCRQRGLPASHSISEVLGESILFCMDFAVNQATKGQLLYRMHDDFWFWAPAHQTCVAAWHCIGQFAKVMGVTINASKAGSVRITKVSKEGSSIHTSSHESLPQGKIRWGLLYLDPQSGRFVIDEAMVDKHIKELQHQLVTKDSIFAWIQVWNTYANTFFTTNFGKPAHCYGQAHIDMILSNLARIQRKVFGTQNVVESLKSRLKERFGVEDIPDGYIFFPTELGGLEVMSPFVGMLQIRDSVLKNPEELLDQFEVDEKEQYYAAKMSYEKGQVQRYGLNSPDWKPTDETFFSFDEFAKYREEFEGAGNDLRCVFDELRKRPNEEDIEVIPEVMTSLNQLSGGGCINGNWYGMTSYWKWIAQLYGPEIIAKFEGLSIVDAGLLPIGMVSLLRSGRVKWTG
jgi:hypothetical protein